MCIRDRYSTKSISIAMAESWAADNLTLSSRLYGRSKSIKQSVADTLTQAFKTNKAVRCLLYTSILHRTLYISFKNYQRKSSNTCRSLEYVFGLFRL